MPFATWVSDRLREIAGISELWINTSERALGFLFAFVLVVGSLLFFERMDGWRIVGAFPAAESLRDPDLLAHDIAGLKADGADMVVLLGGSTVRELTSGNTRLSRKLSTRCGRPIEVLNAGSSSQTFPQSWGIAENIHERRRRLILVGLNYYRMREGYAEARRGLATSAFPFRPGGALRNLLSEVGHAPGLPLPQPVSLSWIVKNAGDINWLRPWQMDRSKDDDVHALKDPFKGPRNGYSRPEQPISEKLSTARRYLFERTAAIDEFMVEGGNLWLGFANHFSKGKSRVAFMILPVSPSFEGVVRVIEPSFRKEITKLEMAGYGVEDLRNIRLLEERDFYDVQHLLASGRRKVEPLLVDVIASLLGDCEHVATP